MKLEDSKTILYRQEGGSCAAEIPALPGCHALMDTREKGLTLPADSTEIVNA